MPKNFINIHTHQKNQNSCGNFALFNAFDKETDVPCSYGIHPWYVEKASSEQFLRLEKLIQQENCYAVGECGLDKLTQTAWDLQLTTFERQIELSEKYQKPLLIHCVKAVQEIVVLKRKHQPQQPWIFHGFRKTNTVQQLLENGFFISIGTAILTDEKLQTSIVDIPLEKLFLETDDKAISIRAVYEKVAELRQLSITELASQLVENFNTVFTTYSSNQSND
ncbi:MAG TPA: TatD family hydrolase [Crocinitomicaceae bacterium]|nr:TatD family hydrolase [Crocinitomicaceae bacterium]